MQISKIKIRRRLNFIYLFPLYSFILWGGSWVIIGLSAKENFYSAFVASYLNYPQKLRCFLLDATAYIVHKRGYSATVFNEFLLHPGGGGVHVAYSCMGIGVASIWLAFVLSYGQLSAVSRFLAAFAGIAVLTALNISRIYLLFISDADHFLGVDQHDLFNGIIHLLLLVAALLTVYFNEKPAQNESYEGKLI